MKVTKDHEEFNKTYKELVEVRSVEDFAKLLDYKQTISDLI